MFPDYIFLTWITWIIISQSKSSSFQILISWYLDSLGILLWLLGIALYHTRVLCVKKSATKTNLLVFFYNLFCCLISSIHWKTMSNMIPEAERIGWYMDDNTRKWFIFCQFDKTQFFEIFFDPLSTLVLVIDI